MYIVGKSFGCVHIDILNVKHFNIGQYWRGRYCLPNRRNPGYQNCFILPYAQLLTGSKIYQNKTMAVLIKIASEMPVPYSLGK